MAKIAIIYCKRIKDHSCIACMKCYKGIKERNGEFARHSEIDLVAMTDCGDCPGLAVPRVRFLMEYAKTLGREIETLIWEPVLNRRCRQRSVPSSMRI